MSLALQQALITSMIALEADHRPTFEKALSDFRNTVFPDYFYTFMNDYVVNLAADHHVPNSTMTNDPIARSYGHADSIIIGICRDWDGMIAAMIEEHDLSVSRLSEAEQKGEDDHFQGEDISKYSTQRRLSSWRTILSEIAL